MLPTHLFLIRGSTIKTTVAAAATTTKIGGNNLKSEFFTFIFQLETKKANKKLYISYFMTKNHFSTKQNKTKKKNPI